MWGLMVKIIIYNAIMNDLGRHIPELQPAHQAIRTARLLRLRRIFWEEVGGSPPPPLRAARIMTGVRIHRRGDPAHPLGKVGKYKSIVQWCGVDVTVRYEVAR